MGEGGGERDGDGEDGDRDERKSSDIEDMRGYAEDEDGYDDAEGAMPWKDDFIGDGADQVLDQGDGVEVDDAIDWPPSSSS